MIQEDDFKGTLKTLLAEAFGVSENLHGYFLDSGQAGFLTILDNISAEIASQSVRPGNATIAAHCEHVNFILDVVRNPEVDWPVSWHISTVNEQEWQQVRQTLRQRYEALPRHRHYARMERQRCRRGDDHSHSLRLSPGRGASNAVRALAAHFVNQGLKLWQPSLIGKDPTAF